MAGYRLGLISCIHFLFSGAALPETGKSQLKLPGPKSELHQVTPVEQQKRTRGFIRAWVGFVLPLIAVDVNARAKLGGLFHASAALQS